MKHKKEFPALYYLIEKEYINTDKAKLLRRVQKCEVYLAGQVRKVNASIPSKPISKILDDEID